jgi:REP-associated tyrosine transposase
MWNLPPPPGFQGLDPTRPLTLYVRHLPHWRQDGATYFVTFRLHDSLPQSKLQELASLRKDWARRNPPPHSNEKLEELARETMRRVEHWLDQGMGSCRLREPAAAQAVASAMHHFDGERYELDCYVVMFNHVHVVVRPFQGATDPLEKILQSWKRHTSLEINQQFGIEGRLWQEESFDRIIRDEEHLYRVLQYVGNNPGRAGLNPLNCLIWIRPSWEGLGWTFPKE